MGSGQSAGRKFGRHRDRSASMKQYRNSNRAAANKAKKVAKHQRTMAKKAARISTARGTARAKRRGNKHVT